MDSDEFDEFDDDIAYEDLILAVSQAPGRSELSKPHTGPFQPPVSWPSVAAAQDGFTSRQMSNESSANTQAAQFIDLDDFPSDAFSSSPIGNVTPRDARPGPQVAGPVQNYRQTTLFGTPIQGNGDSGSSQRLNSNRVFRADMPPEAPTHHEIDLQAMKTWVYPTNLGPIRDYQYSIVKNGLFHNTLVALPTGLGKTFIAATVMLNFFRWTKTAKIIFVAPTKPLVSQQVDACFKIVGIPRSQTTLLTGEVPPALRAEEWATKRVFFMTPQTLENDLSRGIADPKSICLLVVDEAHRATGNYAYVKVVNFIRRFSKSFRILALTATPGSKVEAVQEVIDSLGISHVEIRTEESLDLRPYVHRRDENIIALDPSEEMNRVKDLFSKALKPLVDKLSQQNIYYGRDPMSLTTYGLMQARKDWLSHGGQHVNQGVKFMMVAIFTILQSLAHSIKLLNFHGIKPFYDNMIQFRDETEGKGEKGSKNKRQVIESPEFQKMMSTLRNWVSKDSFVGHPKLISLCDTVLNHFMDADEGREGIRSSNTRIIVFSEYRDSAEEIVRVLNRHKPMIQAAVFVGQADTKNSEGMKQSEQIDRIKKFKDGTFNVLVATSIGEEGLDIGQVDLIICYDASASPIRMLQRMGRTGRKRAGRVVLLLMRGKEEDNYAKSKDGYEKMQLMICEGSRFAFRHDLSTRFVPRDIKPEVDKQLIEIPIENTQNDSLPEPRKGRARKKMPRKKFNMPDGVDTGFISVASMLGKRPSKPAKPKQSVEEMDVTDIPELTKVLLNDEQTNELRRIYQNLPFYQDKPEVIETVDMTANPLAQRVLRKSAHLEHGEHTKRWVKLFRTLGKSQSNLDQYSKPYGETDQSQYDKLPLPNDVSDSELESPPPPPPRKKIRASLFPDNDELEGIIIDTSQAKSCKQRPQPAPKPRKGPQQRKQVQPPFSDTLLEAEDENATEYDSPRPRQRQKAPPKKLSAKTTKGKGSRALSKRQAHAYDESADEGDDCRRTSDLELSVDSDDGSDLVDFVVDDDMATSSMQPTSSLRQRSTSPTSLSASSVLPARRKPFYEPIVLSATQESDDMPSMSQLAGKKRPQARDKTTAGESEDSDDEVVQRAGRQTKRRLVLNEDDESDE
ncbi:uncharacterized protein BCR38DRAFT_388888 [Pseudomassariella vexata]|uniref:ATP-dependent DNA helicase n=1 Tax=Pseudomassariella vexata TaxID=1141098 RepID=A0A1Y2E382_9PEZI|nr:uncharacterized protein BCR38DRAFT_388888 [Pseudomassariella vexata]ORY65824.1 hypothetical protein BCR38DRAFT_388888 [Pseudomassariella vexata]